MDVPEISPAQLAEKLGSQEPFFVLDVREDWEVALVRLDDPHVIVLPMSRIAREREGSFSDALREPDSEIVVMCHHGVRSADVTAWMLQSGWENVRSLAGGIDAYAVEIDPSVGQY